MAFDETKKCSNCLFRLEEPDVDSCRFNAPVPLLWGKTAPDLRQSNRSLYPPCPGPACGQWQPETEPEIEELEVLPHLVSKE